MGVYVTKRTYLIDLLQDCAAHGYSEFVNDILVRNITTIKMYAYIFEGYWRPISNIQLFYRANMELLNPAIRKDLLMGNRRIFTKVKDETPAKYNEEASVRNTIVADGCIIEGDVENSLLFRGVKVMKGAVIKNSIIMQGSVIEADVHLTNAILDKDVTITVGKHLQGDAEWPLIVGKGVTV